MRQKKLKVITNKKVGSKEWMEDPTISDETVELFNNFIQEMANIAGKPEAAKKYIWNRKKNNNSNIKIVK